MSEQGVYACLRAARHRGLVDVDGLLWALTDAGKEAVAPDLIVSCKPTSTPPAVPSERARCAKCRAEVWITAATRGVMARYHRPQIVCTGCRPLPPAGTTLATSQEQVSELAGLGVSPQAVADRFDLTLINLDDPDAV